MPGRVSSDDSSPEEKAKKDKKDKKDKKTEKKKDKKSKDKKKRNMMTMMKMTKKLMVTMYLWDPVVGMMMMMEMALLILRASTPFWNQMIALLRKIGIPKSDLPQAIADPRSDHPEGPLKMWRLEISFHF